jgi:hypothetical protein
VRPKEILKRQGVNWKENEREIKVEERENQERIKRDREKWTWAQRVRGEVTSEKGTINTGDEERKKVKEAS